MYLQELKKLVNDERQKEEYKKHDCFVMALLSHGNRGNIFAFDSEEVSPNFFVPQSFVYSTK